MSVVFMIAFIGFGMIQHSMEKPKKKLVSNLERLQHEINNYSLKEKDKLDFSKKMTVDSSLLYNPFGHNAKVKTIKSAINDKLSYAISLDIENSYNNKQNACSALSRVSDNYKYIKIGNSYVLPSMPVGGLFPETFYHRCEKAFKIDSSAQANSNKTEIYTNVTLISHESNHDL